MPLDPSYQADRLAGYIEDSAAPVVITQRALEPQARALVAAAAAASGRAPAAVLFAEDVMAPGAGAAGASSGADVQLPTMADDDLCYCMFTSGSTVRARAAGLGRAGPGRPWVE